MRPTSMVGAGRCWDMHGSVAVLGVRVVLLAGRGMGGLCPSGAIMLLLMALLCLGLPANPPALTACRDHRRR